jgi:hypothetical protein
MAELPHLLDSVTVCRNLKPGLSKAPIPSPAASSNATQRGIASQFRSPEIVAAGVRYWCRPTCVRLPKRSTTPPYLRGRQWRRQTRRVKPPDGSRPILGQAAPPVGSPGAISPKDSVFLLQPPAAFSKFPAIVWLPVTRRVDRCFGPIQKRPNGILSLRVCLPL